MGEKGARGDGVIGEGVSGDDLVAEEEGVGGGRVGR